MEERFKGEAGQRLSDCWLKHFKPKKWSREI